VYHFFAHYRSAVLRQLLEQGRYNYLLVGDRTDPDSAGIKAWEDIPPDHFVYAPWRRLRGRLFWQRGVVKLALRRDIRCLILLGNSKWASTWAAAIAGRLSGKRVLFWTHGWIVPERGLKKFIRRRFYKLAHGLLLYGNGARKIGIEQGFASEK